jgi:hypothetical protein
MAPTDLPLLFETSLKIALFAYVARQRVNFCLCSTQPTCTNSCQRGSNRETTKIPLSSSSFSSPISFGHWCHGGRLGSVQGASGMGGGGGPPRGTSAPGAAASGLALPRGTAPGAAAASLPPATGDSRGPPTATSILQCRRSSPSRRAGRAPTRVWTPCGSWPPWSRAAAGGGGIRARAAGSGRQSAS